MFCCAVVCRAAAQSPESDPPAPAPATPPATKAHPLKQILLADSPEAAKALPAQPGGPFVVASGSLKQFDGADLTQRLIAAKDHNIDTQLLGVISQALTTYARQHGYLIAGVNIPEQSIADGVLRLAIVPGKFRQIKFVGNRWFSDAQLLGDLRVERGEIIQFADLDQAIGWTNDSNPFRRLQARIEQVPNSNEADLVIGVQERLPLRLLAVIDNSGNEVLGQYHYTVGATYANLWNLDHQVTYQYVSTGRGRNFQGHVFNYRAPLPWRHYVQLSASYLRARPEFFGGILNQDAENISGDLRYTIPLAKGNNPGEVFANFSFKDSNNNLEFGGTNVQNSKTDVFEWTLGASKMRRDKLGGWIFGASVTVSPGGVNSRNSDFAFANARLGAKSSYVYGTFTFQRALQLDRGWEFDSRGTFQLADSNLLSSEEQTIGGSATVRGFNENIFAGDEGFVFANDLMLPALHRRVSFRGKQITPIETRFLAFYDVANVRSKHALPIDPRFHPLASTGVGVRMNWASNFSLTADYGWQISHLPYAHDDHSHGHVKVTLAY